MRSSVFPNNGFQNAITLIWDLLERPHGLGHVLLLAMRKSQFLWGFVRDFQLWEQNLSVNIHPRDRQAECRLSCSCAADISDRIFTTWWGILAHFSIKMAYLGIGRITYPLGLTPRPPILGHVSVDPTFMEKGQRSSPMMACILALNSDPSTLLHKFVRNR